MTATTTALKARLLAHCQAYVEQRVETARTAMEAAQASANEESKSSAGDKYETGRAMAQIERDRHAQQLAEARRLQQELDAVDIARTYASVQPGSLVTTDRGTFFIAISLGKVTVDGGDYFVVSAASPVGAALHHRKMGDEVPFNKLVYRILAVA